MAKEKKADAVLGYYCIVEKCECKFAQPYMPENTVLRNKEFRGILCKDSDGKICWFVWKGIYLREFLLQHHIIFRDGKLGEDTVFYLEVLLHINIVCSINRHFYNYVQALDSLIQSRYKAELSSKLNKNYLAKKLIFKQCNLFDSVEVLYDYVMKHSISMLFSNKMKHRVYAKEKAKEYKQMYETEMIKDALKHSSITKIRSKRYRPFMFLFQLKQYYLLALLSN